MVETVLKEVKSEKLKVKSEGVAAPRLLKDVSLKDVSRISTGISEFDRVLGGGVVPGSVVLIAGDPGIGKSTLLLKAASSLKSLYIAGEESPEQIKLRFDRLKIKAPSLFITQETIIDLALEAAEADKYQLLVVDSIQTMETEDLTQAAGSISQVRETAFRAHRYAKETHTAVFIVGHVTKEGVVAGPRVLEHLVDTVLYLEGEAERQFRILRASKNRFGPVDEIGVFSMEESGLEEVKNPSEQFLGERVLAPGSVVVSLLEGTRPIMTEIQALATPTVFGAPRRVSTGVDYNRLTLLVATLIKRAGLALQNQDIFVNVAGGLRLTERSADLGVCLSIASAVLDQEVSSDTVAIGEVGLLGEIRQVPGLDKRIAEAKKLGFKKVITPKEVKTLREAISLALKSKRS
jgi:DNA repair protein RadA/Sms